MTRRGCLDAEVPRNPCASRMVRRTATGCVGRPGAVCRALSRAAARRDAGHVFCPLGGLRPGPLAENCRKFDRRPADLATARLAPAAYSAVVDRAATGRISIKGDTR